MYYYVGYSEIFLCIGNMTKRKYVWAELLYFCTEPNYIRKFSSLFLNSHKKSIMFALDLFVYRSVWVIIIERLIEFAMSEDIKPCYRTNGKCFLIFKMRYWFWFVYRQYRKSKFPAIAEITLNMDSASRRRKQNNFRLRRRDRNWIARKIKV